MVAPRNPNRLAVDTEVAVGLDLARPPWMLDALCREYPHLDWVDAERNKVDKAMCLDVCGRCSVIVECREYAIADGSLVGLWGGCDTAARKAIRRNREVRGGTTATGAPTALARTPNSQAHLSVIHQKAP